MFNYSLEKRSLQKKYIILFLLLGLIVACVLCFANQVSMLIKPVSDFNNSSSVLILKGNQQILVNQGSNDSFQVRFPLLLATPLTASEQNSDKLTNKIIISDIVIKNIFGGTVSFHNLGIATRFVDFINTSQFLDININNHFNASYLPATFSVLYFLCLGISVSLIAFSGLFLIDNLLKFTCVVVSQLIEIVGCYPRSVIVLNSVLLVISLMLSIWCCFVGLLYSDDGFFNLMAQYPQDVLTGLPSTYYQITHLLFLFVGGKLIVFRCFTVISSLISILFLTAVITKYIKYSFYQKLSRVDIYSLFIILLIGNSIQFSHHLTPDYNNLSRIIVYGQASILVLILYNLVDRTSLAIRLVFLLGIITGMNIFIKFPEAISSILVIYLLLITHYKKSSWKFLSFFSFGVTLFIFIYFFYIQSFANFRSLLLNSLYYSKLIDGHQASALLIGNVKDILSFLVFLILYLIIYHWLTKPLRIIMSRVTIAIMATTIILLGVLLLKLIMGRDYQLAFELLYTPVTKAFLMILSTIVYENFCEYRLLNINSKNQYKKLNWLCLLLLIFTYLASLGTDTKILYHVILHPALILLIIILQWFALDKNNASQRYFINTLMIGVTFIFIQGIVFNNAMFVNLFEQTTHYKVGKSDIYLSKASVTSLSQIKQKLTSCGYSDGDYIAAYYAMSDIVYALGGRSPVTPWLSPSTDANKTKIANRYLFSLMSDDVKKHLFVIVNSNRLDSGLTTLGFDAPQKLIYCGTVNISDDNHEFSIKNFTIFRYNDTLVR